MRYIAHIIVIAALLLVSLQSLAETVFSYVYIQGDKQTPFYVKLEDNMLPRYGKNYNLIPQLAPGPINVEILFQQNIYPPQKFTIVVPENGYRGFLLLKKGSIFSLYDINTGKTLLSGNKAEDDIISSSENNKYVYTKELEPAEVDNSYSGTSTTAQTISPKFLPNVELKSERTIVTNPRVEKQIEEPATEPQYSNSSFTISINNTDCPSPINSDDFEDLFNKAQSKNEKVRLKYLLGEMEQCYTTSQARMLAKTLDNDPERYTFLKRVYPRVTDQAEFPVLESLLSTQEWKSYFRLILP